jgi:GDP-L-fucose synthase
MKKESKIYVAGHTGLVGSALVRNLQEAGFHNLLVRTHPELDLIDQQAVREFMGRERPEYVFIAAAKVGGILYNNNYQADFLYENLMMSANLVHSAAESGVKKLLYLGSSCIYPKHAAQPIREESLLTGPLEPTNEGYALAKIAGLKLCEKYFHQYGKCFVSVMPTNLYGPGDNFHPEHSHVIPGMMRRFHEAKLEKRPEVVIWGTGKPKREFLHVDDLARGLILVMKEYENPETLNIGTGQDCTILELASLMKEVVGYPGEIMTDASKPDGTPRKVLDVHRIKSLGWEPGLSLADGLRSTYAWALEHRVFDR